MAKKDKGKNKPKKVKGLPLSEAIELSLRVRRGALEKLANL